MDNPQYNWVNQLVKQRMKTKNKAKKLIDIIDEMNLKEDTTNKMVIEKLDILAKLIFDIDGFNDDVDFVSTIMEDLIESPHKRITKLEIEKCNRLYKQYSSLSTDNRKSTEENMWKLIDSMLTQENPSKIQAIKMYRKFVNSTLREAKDIVDAREQKIKRGW